MKVCLRAMLNPEMPPTILPLKNQEKVAHRLRQGKSGKDEAWVCPDEIDCSGKLKNRRVLRPVQKACYKYKQRHK